MVSFDAATGSATFLLSNPSAGTYTLVAEAMYDDSSGTPTEVDSSPSTFSVASFTVKTNSWNPNPAYVGQIISGQVQGKFDPSSIDGGGGGPTFVIYNWTTAGVWYSQDGTAGTFEPYGGNGIVSWQQGQASTKFSALFNDAGYYILEVSCVATVYSQSTGNPVATFTGTGYIGNQSDIDTSGDTGHVQKAHVMKARAGGGGDIPVLFPQFEVDINDTPQTSDDLVGVGETTPCEIKLTSGGQANADMNLTLTAVTKPGGGNITITPSVTIVKGTSTAAFTISGTAGSSAFNDVTIHVVGGTAPQDMPVTVYHFDKPSITVTPDGSYSLNGISYAATPDAVTVKASITLNPSGVNTSAPQVSAYMLGVEQNGGARTDKAVFANPTVTWTARPPGGVFSEGIPETYVIERQITGGNDAPTSSTTPPFYQPGTSINSAGTPTVATVTDNPNFSVKTHKYNADVYSGATKIGTVTYILSYIGITSTFADWCSLWNSNKSIMAHLTSSGWAINVQSNSANQNAHTASGSMNTPIETGDTCNQQLMNLKNWSVNNGSGNLTITYPDNSPH